MFDYKYPTLLRQRLQADLINFFREPGADVGQRAEMKRLIKDTGVASINGIPDDKLMAFAKAAVAIMTPKKPRVQAQEDTPPPVKPRQRHGRLSFDEACLPEEDRGPEYASGEELDLLLGALVVARGKLGEEGCKQLLFDFTGEQAFCAAAIKAGDGEKLALKLISACEEAAVDAQ